MNEKTSVSHWDSIWSRRAAFRHSTNLNVAIADRRRVLSAHVKQGMRYLEIGCAPGIMLSYVAQNLGAEVYGLDYSSIGIAQTEDLFKRRGLKATLFCEDVFNSALPREYFDVVHSGGVIEHFADPRELVRIHVELLKSGGVALITIPNFGGLYGDIAARTDPENLAIHNTEIMHPDRLKALAPSDISDHVTAVPFGRVSLSAVSFRSRLSGLFAKAGLNTLGLLQPLTVNRLAPWLLLRITRR